MYIFKSQWVFISGTVPSFMLVETSLSNHIICHCHTILTQQLWNFVWGGVGGGGDPSIKYKRFEKSIKAGPTLSSKLVTLKYMDGLVHERHNSSVLAMELCLSCINPSIWCLLWIWSLTHGQNIPDSKVHGAATWGPPGSCQPQMGPMLTPWTLLSGIFYCMQYSGTVDHVMMGTNCNK